jgi:basic membrane lipoprotein Med (substrate-binding protein (PBP1-ABC) superfamily)
MEFLKRVGFLLICGLALLSCEIEGDTVYINTDEDDIDRDMIFFFSKKGSLGDLGYVDALYRGVVRGANGCNLMLSLMEFPTDTSAALSTLEHMLDYMRTEKPDRNALVVIANENFEPFLHRYESILTKAPNVDFLLCESSDTTLPIYTLKIPQYGVYYQAGMLASEGMADADSILIVSANPSDKNIAEMRKGFTQAIKDYNSNIYVENTFISDTTGGYDRSSYAYQQSYDIDKRFDLVVPLCGGTAQGFYRYNRENPESFYTLGVDTDMQLYSTKVPFSVVKNLEDVLDSWIFNWWREESELKKHQAPGISSGATGIVVADSYKSALDGIAEKYYELAVKKEQEYENQ